MTARRLAAQAVEIGRRFGVPELEMVGLGLEGIALVSEGDLDTGMRRLDEAVAAALSGEAELLVCVAWACCYLIAACEQVRDYDRAGEWCERVGEFCERHGIALPLSVCRAKYAGVLTWQGRWEEAEDELRLAADGLAASRPPLVGDALVRLAELRRRQGRLDEAEELFGRCEGKPMALLGRAAVALDRDRPSEAAELAERFLRPFPTETEPSGVPDSRSPSGPTVRRATMGGPGEALDQLEEIAARAGTRPLRAAVLTAEATVAAAAGRSRCRQALSRGRARPVGTEWRAVRDRPGPARPGCRAQGAGTSRARPPRDRNGSGRVRRLGADGAAAQAEALLAEFGEAEGRRPSRPSDGPLARLSPRSARCSAWWPRVSPTRTSPSVWFSASTPCTAT